jgi:hypothetical protein
LAVVAAFLAAAGLPALYAASASAESSVEQAAVTWAKHQASANPSGYGGACLKFVRLAYAAGGFSLPGHVVGVAWNGNTFPDQVWPHTVGGAKGSASTPPPLGALVFFRAGTGGDSGSRPSHVEIYVGNGNSISTEDYAGAKIHSERYGAHPRELGWWLPDATGGGTGNPGSSSGSPSSGGASNPNGQPNIYEILHQNSSSGMTEVKELNGATNFTSWAGGWITPDGWHSGDDVSYVAAGSNPNGQPNIYEILHQNSSSGMTEVKELNGATNFTSWAGGWITPDGWHSGDDVSYVAQ